MSAIGAFWSLDGTHAADQMAARMGEALAMHGPDAAGTWGDRAVALAWRGRTILPEDPLDRQPRAGGSAAVLAADCRIDNRSELRHRLGLGQGGTPLPDSAFVLAAYEAWGERCVDHLVGDFAFAVWDPARERLFAARDHMGMRPLYFHRGRGFFALASMPRGLFALPGVARTLNQVKLLDILLVLGEAGTDTLYQGIERIPAGHTLTVTSSGHRLERYWSAGAPPPLEPASDAEYEEALVAALREAVRCRLRTVDGPVAAHLSGGLDSGSVATLAAEELAGEDRRLLALTAAPRAGFQGPVPSRRFADEDRYAAMVAQRHANVDHVVVREGGGLLDGVDAFTAAAEVPILNLCNQRWLATLADTARSAGARVLLGARGGNMTISWTGMHPVTELVRSGRWGALARRVLRPGGDVKGDLRRAISAAASTTAIRRRAIRAAAYRDLLAVSAVDPRRHPQRVVEERGRACAWPPGGDPAWGSRAKRAAALVRMDEAPFRAGSEALSGLQLVDPTIDKRVVELCLALPEEQYYRDGESRRIIRRAMKGRLPDALLAERQKGYQGADWYEALRAEVGGIAEELDRCASNPTAAGLMDLDGLRHDLRRLPEGEWGRSENVMRYRFRLLRGLALASFIRRVEDGG